MGKKKILNVAILCIFPILLTLIVELNQLQSLQGLFGFVFESFGVFVFDCILILGFFLFVCVFFKRAYLPMIIVVVIFFTLSCIEYYKFQTTGTHFILSDLFMAKTLKDVSSFAKMDMNLMLISTFFVLAIYIVIAVILRIRINIYKKARYFILTAFIVAIITFLVKPSVFYSVSGIFGIEAVRVDNTFEQDDEFEEKNMLAFVTLKAVEDYLQKVEKPDNYNFEKVYDIMKESGSNDEDPSYHEKSNVIVIMSESFSDYRKFRDIDDDVYKGFDKVKEESFWGTCIVPTFGGYTSRSEFELMWGLPDAGLNNAPMPQLLMEIDNPKPTVVQYYKSLGYNTTYIHPFSASFYDRKKLYPSYGFDNLIFEENMDKPKRFGRYIDDKFIFSSALELLKSTQGSDFMFLTTMQNHQPYESFEKHIDGIKNTSDGLFKFVEELKKLDEPITILFVGDHFPFFDTQTKIYEQAGITAENCSEIYEKTYLIWNNFGAPYSDLPDRKKQISLFYLPYMLSKVAGVEGDRFFNAMEGIMKEKPTYSPRHGDDKNFEKLDILTYDKVLGKNYASANLTQ